MFYGRLTILILIYRYTNLEAGAPANMVKTLGAVKVR